MHTRKWYRCAHHYVNASSLMLWRPMRTFLDVRMTCRPNPRKLARRTNSWSMHFFANTSRFRTANDRKWDALGMNAFRTKSPPREITSTSHIERCSVPTKRTHNARLSDRLHSRSRSLMCVYKLKILVRSWDRNSDHEDIVVRLSLLFKPFELIASITTCVHPSIRKQKGARTASLHCIASDTTSKESISGSRVLGAIVRAM